MRPVKSFLAMADDVLELFHGHQFVPLDFVLLNPLETGIPSSSRISIASLPVFPLSNDVRRKFCRLRVYKSEKILVA